MISVGRNEFPIGSTIYQDKEKTGLTKNFLQFKLFWLREKVNDYKQKWTVFREKRIGRYFVGPSIFTTNKLYSWDYD